MTPDTSTTSRKLIVSAFQRYIGVWVWVEDGVIMTKNITPRKRFRCYFSGFMPVLTRPIRFFFWLFFSRRFVACRFCTSRRFFGYSAMKNQFHFLYPKINPPDGFIFKLKINPFPMDLFLPFFCGKPVPPQVDNSPESSRNPRDNGTPPPHTHRSRLAILCINCRAAKEGSVTASLRSL
jgi:hypothetical protein